MCVCDVCVSNHLRAALCVLLCVSVFSMLQCAAVRCSVLQRLAACCSVLQCVAVCCSVLRGEQPIMRGMHR